MKAESSAFFPRLEELVLQNVSEIIVITDMAFCVQSWNGIAEKFYGIPAAEAIGRRMGELVKFTFHDTTAEESIQVLRGKKDVARKSVFF
jgi:PAS domain-containing protein